ncbi:hypothetical protein GCM10027589_12660 [Actinocorallia lasiicapitis]
MEMRAAVARLEVALSGAVRWSESRRVRLEVVRRSGCELRAAELRLLEHFDLVPPMRITDVAGCLGVDVSTVSLQLRGLSRDGLIERSKDERDLRVTLVGITPEGRAVVGRVRAARRDLLAEVLSQGSDEAVDQAAAVLIRFQEHMLDGG